jgi:large subunit ribosomal protein L9
MEIILVEEMPNLGEVGDVVSVKPGYARNFLFPRGIAIPANERQKRRVAHDRQQLEAKVAKLKESASAEATKLDKVSLTIEKAAGENGKLFGSVTTMEIEAMLRAQGFEIDRRRIMLAEPIKALGETEVEIKLHRDVRANIKLQVVAQSTDD